MVEATDAPVCSLCSLPMEVRVKPEATSAAACLLSFRAAEASASFFIPSSFWSGPKRLVLAESKGIPISATTAAVAALTRAVGVLVSRLTCFQLVHSRISQHKV